ncbi:MAG: sigma-54-dependent Fis family transcriptional regulator [Ignavibacteriae bacterium]|nr:sigma-54-dependent Fis family transcriptional regulator [Ignavibacteriota bacterium]MCB0723494.1 sigma-54-dependent Fis family transcriptional regulator [Ignavibacteriota bacterium]MCB9244461.1 sigma-54-dependent Fis family transcriptional regulator [Ignavibacteriales bacterium]
MKNILIVDDDLTSLISLKKVLEDTGYGVMTVSNGEEALKKFADFKFDVLLTDLMMPGIDGIELTKRALLLDSEIVVILITAFGSLKTAVEAMNMGAYSYLTKPLDHKELLLTISRGLEYKSLKQENMLLKRELEKNESNAVFLSENKKIKEILHDAKLVAQSDSTVLIIGDDGTGKEHLARFIHEHSLRKDHKFISISCLSMPKTLLESEIFGHQKGSFDGALENHKGYMETADSGTIFIDDIQALDPLMQVKLLNVLENRTFSRKGSSKLTATNARIIVASKDNLKDLADQGKFNRDLYFKVNVFEFTLPSLKERPEDVILYFQKFIKEFAVKNKKHIKEISPEVKKALVNHSWPGNLTELKNVSERMSILAKNGVITVDLLPHNISKREDTLELLPSKDFNESKHALIKSFETVFIKKYLKLNNGNVTATARDINFHPVTLRQKISKLGINPREFKQ